MLRSPVNLPPCAHLSCPTHTYTVLFSFPPSSSPQDDYRVCMDFNIIQKDSVPVCPVDASGCFTAEVPDFVGQYVKVCDCDAEGCCFLTLISLISS